MEIINNKKSNKTGKSCDEIFEMLIRNELSFIEEHGEDLENYYVLFELNDTYIIAKNCQSVHDWHVLEFYSNFKEAKQEFNWYKENDSENNFVI